MNPTDYFFGIRPCVCDTNGKRYYGINHCEAIASIPYGKVLDVEQGELGHCFECQLDHSLIDRQQAALLTGLTCNVQNGRLHSEDLHWQGPKGPANRPDKYLKDKDGIDFDSVKTGELVKPEFIATEEWKSARQRIEQKQLQESGLTALDY